MLFVSEEFLIGFFWKKSYDWLMRNNSILKQFFLVTVIKKKFVVWEL